MVLFECGLQLLALGGLGHFRQGGQDLLLGEVDVFQSVMKQFVQLLRLFCHFQLSNVLNLRRHRRGETGHLTEGRMSGSTGRPQIATPKACRIPAATS